MIFGKSKQLKSQSLLKLSLPKKDLCTSIKDMLFFKEVRERLKKHDLQQKDVHPMYHMVRAHIRQNIYYTI